LAIPAADLLTLTGARPTTVDAPATRAVTDLVLEPTVALRPKLVTAGAGFIGLATDGTELAANSIRAGIG
jgi:NADPH-dependent 2,4-dienoyl-CoA reductase/sulfur reductase-like enzyme